MARPTILYVAVTFVLLTLLVHFTALRSHRVRHISAPPSSPFTTTAVTPYARPPPTRRLHLLIVASNSGLDLCRLLLSASILSYPPPVLIDWGGQGDYDASNHLAKIAGPLRYFDRLPPSSDTDLVLLLDGFDVVLQLGPDVMLERYFAAMADDNRRLASHFGADHVRKHAIYNSILYGPDKVCFPIDFRRPACWLVPESPMPPDAFGPETDQDMEHARPRWLNSGTVMGPVADMRALFRASWHKMNKTFDIEDEQHNSDQKYLSDVWADQEYARMLSTGGPVVTPMPHMVPEDIRDNKTMPELEPGQPAEFHTGIDYFSRLFQTMTGYTDYLTWMTFNHPAVRGDDVQTAEAWNLHLDKDVLESRKPYAALAGTDHAPNPSWKDVPLGVNTVTGLPFALLHYTGDKSFRDLWWKRMWYFKDAERLLRASLEKGEETIGSKAIGGSVWLKHIPHDARDGSDGGKADGMWSDEGERFSWDGLCKDHEELLYSGEIPPRPEEVPEEQAVEEATGTGPAAETPQLQPSEQP